MKSGRTPTLEVQTPEGVVFSLLLAGPVTRFLAWTVDAACVASLTYVVAIASPIFSVINPDLALGAVTFVAFLIRQCYSMTLEWVWRGQTLGKRVLRLRVVDHNGLRLQFSQVALRNLLRPLDSLPFLYAVGGIASLLSPRGQRLGDLAANTVVIRTPLMREPDLKQVATGKYNSLRDHPHIAARLRSQATPAEASLALEAILRRDLLTPAARLEVFAALAARFRGHAAFPEETLAGMSDEQFVRNAVELLYTRDGQPGLAARAAA